MNTLFWFTLGIGLAPAYASTAMLITRGRAPDLWRPATHLTYISETVAWALAGQAAGVYGAVTGLLVLLASDRRRR